MIGQEAVNVAETFWQRLSFTGVCLSKMDGDTRGGAALSIKRMTGVPICFIGVGEKLPDIELFHPDRMASRILGMGDVLTLIEKAEASFDEKKAKELEERLRANKFTLSDFYDQLVQLKSMGSMQDILSMMPGMDAKALSGANIDEKAMARTEAIIQSMTPYERENPGVIGSSRRKRIAAGSGTTVIDVNKLLRQFDAMQKLMKQVNGMSGKKKKRMQRMGGFPGMPSGFGF